MNGTMNQINQYVVFWVDLNPTLGGEMNIKRPCVVTSPDDLNDFLDTVIIAPLTNTKRDQYPFRFKAEVGAVSGWVALDQIRAVDKRRLGNRIGELRVRDIAKIKQLIKEMLVD